MANRSHSRIRRGRPCVVVGRRRLLPLLVLVLLIGSTVAGVSTIGSAITGMAAISGSFPADAVVATTGTAGGTAALEGIGYDRTFSRIAAGKLTRCLGQQIKDTEYHTPKEHVHRQFLKQTFGAKPRQPTLPSSSSSYTTPGSLAYLAKVALAGGIAGATGTAALFPVDAAKTLRQSAPHVYRNVRHALWQLVRTPRPNGGAVRWHLGRAYCGVLPATLGAIPSSALYFGAYESVKPLLRQWCNRHTDWISPRSRTGRGCIHSGAAAAGNVLSSAVFVPKEVIKQHMQYAGTSVGRAVREIVQSQGLRGFYSGYGATLLRNIPSSVLRFTIYEELKQIFVLDNEKDRKKTGFNWKLFAAGAAAGAISSGLMTPVDVIKTRMATGTCPVDMPGCIQHVIAEGGITGLYMGAGSRIVWSTVFAAIGFGMLETAKGWLGVADAVTAVPPVSGSTKAPAKEYKMFSRHQRSLEHAVSDKYE